MRRNPIPLLAALVALGLGLTGCGTMTRLAKPLRQAGSAVFTSATLSDLVLTGVKSGPLIPVQASPSGGLDQETSVPAAGVLLPIMQVGETTPWWIFCPAGPLQKRCEEVPANARVTFTGRPLGRGSLLLPSRITWSE
ncbi:MAG TPA: hypothetical protein VKM72_12850 [Thermoanaerobaculia bacterium]|nr:hypothetical protein [Thermoanaerobaculia bacterium]